MSYRNEIEQLYLASFSIEERRPLTNFWQNIDSGKTVCHVFEHENQFAGFVTVWDLGEFFYGEYFAMCPELRNQGLGRKFLSNLLQQMNKPFVLEAEPPTNALATRRIGFYERIGFKLCDTFYQQPAYSADLNGLELKLMEYNGNVLDTNFNAVVKTIYHHVYNKEFTF